LRLSGNQQADQRRKNQSVSFRSHIFECLGSGKNNSHVAASLRAKRTRNVISCIGTMTGLAQTGFSVTTVADWIVAPMAVKLVNKTDCKFLIG
jgi:hypothetical protein